MAAEATRKAEEQRRLKSQYGANSLSNGSQHYSQWYGINVYYDDYTPHSEIRVKAPRNSDVIAIVRYNNHNGKVAGHKYIKASFCPCILKNSLLNKRLYPSIFDVILCDNDAKSGTCH